MPIYEYECSSCSHRFEIIQKVNELPVTKCEACGGVVRKVISQSSFVLKGTGWYLTDYAKKSSGKEKEGESSKASEKSSTKEPVST